MCACACGVVCESLATALKLTMWLCARVCVLVCQMFMSAMHI